MCYRDPSVLVFTAMSKLILRRKHEGFHANCSVLLVTPEEPRLENYEKS
jgi:hypothetical protein